MDLHSYPYHFVQKMDDSSIDNSFLKCKWLYAFKSLKSHQWYWVWVEVYEHHFYAVKFHLKNHRNSPYKYNLLTGLNEARPIINTCVAIMEEVAGRDERSSFIKKSTYLLVRKTELEEKPGLLSELDKKFSELYSFFD